MPGFVETGKQQFCALLTKSRSAQARLVPFIVHDPIRLNSTQLFVCLLGV